jgi:hypothetical protein
MCAALDASAHGDWPPGIRSRRLHRLPEPAPEDCLDPPQPDTHSFVMRVWVEDRCDKSGVVRWRGSITHVPSGRTHYFEDLSDMCAFVASHMEAS